MTRACGDGPQPLPRQVVDAVKTHPTYRFNLDRRSGKDRRGSRRFQFAKQLITGQRTSARRSSDLNRIVYFDRYSPKLLRLIVVILVLSVTDAIFTVNLIGMGAVEINPLMDFYLKIGPKTFLAVKYALTSLSVFILVIYSNAALKDGRFPIRSVFPWIIIALAGVVVWEIYLMVKVTV